MATRKNSEVKARMELEVCESVGGKREIPKFHVELRFVPHEGAHSVCLQGEKHSERAQAEADQKNVERLLKMLVFKRTRRSRA